MSVRRAILALDQGTTSSRAIVFSIEPESFGEPLGEGRRDLARRFPKPGHGSSRTRSRSGRRSATAARGGDRRGAGLRRRSPRSASPTSARRRSLWDRATGEPVAPGDRLAGPAHRRGGPTRCARDGHERVDPRERTGLALRPLLLGDQARVAARPRSPTRGARAERGELAFGTVDTWLLWNLTGRRSHATDAPTPPHACCATSQRELVGRRTACALPRAARGASAVVPSSGEAGRCRILGGDLPVAGDRGRPAGRLVGQALHRAGRVEDDLRHGVLPARSGRRTPVASESRLLTTAAWQVAERRRSTRWRAASSWAARRSSGCATASASSPRRRRSRPLAASVDDSAGRGPRAGVHRAWRATVGSPRPRHGARTHPRCDRGASRARGARGDRLPGGRRDRGGGTRSGRGRGSPGHAGARRWRRRGVQRTASDPGRSAWASGRATGEAREHGARSGGPRLVAAGVVPDLAALRANRKIAHRFEPCATMRGDGASGRGGRRRSRSRAAGAIDSRGERAKERSHEPAKRDRADGVGDVRRARRRRRRDRLGVALDAAVPGLPHRAGRAHDFAQAPRSRSTKLVHGGVRYLSRELRAW